MKLTESGIQKACMELLAAENIPFWRMNAGDRFGTHKGKTWRIRGHEKGTADLLALPKLRHEAMDGWSAAYCDSPLWLEIKRPGGEQSDEQKDFERRMTARGHVYLVITDPQQLIDWLKAHKER